MPCLSHSSRGGSGGGSLNLASFLENIRLVSQVTMPIMHSAPPTGMLSGRLLRTNGQRTRKTQSTSHTLQQRKRGKKPVEVLMGRARLAQKEPAQARILGFVWEKRTPWVNFRLSPVISVVKGGPPSAALRSCASICGPFSKHNANPFLRTKPAITANELWSVL